MLVLTGELWPALSFVMRAPAVLVDIFVFGLTSALGQNFVFFILHEAGALVLAAVTTSRKFFSILISIALWKHSLSVNQMTGVAAVFGGLALEMVGKYRKSKHKKHEHPEHGPHQHTSGSEVRRSARGKERNGESAAAKSS